MSDQPPSDRPRNPAETLELDRIVELDGVRGLALAMVLWIHCFLLHPTNLLAKLANAIGGSMYISLDLFFVLSGFLITSILIKTRGSGHRARNFYVRRVLRIFPAYYFILVFVFFIYPLFYEPLREAHVGKDAPYFFFYVQNLWQAAINGPPSWPGLDHLWSMAVEEQFYLLWPMVVWLTPARQLFRVCLGVVAASVAIKLSLLAAGAGVLQIYLPTYCRLDGLAAGGALAALWQVHGLRATPRWLKAAGLLSTAMLAYLILRKSGHKMYPAEMTAHTIVATVSFSWMIFATVTAPPAALIRRFFRNGVLRFLGRYSYGIYLLHYVVYWQIKYFVIGLFGQTAESASNLASTTAGVAIVAATLVLALAMYKVIEEPALRLKRFFTSSGAHDAARRAPVSAVETAP